MSEDVFVSLPVPSELNPAGLVMRVVGTREDPQVSLADLVEMLGYKNVSAATRAWVERLGKERVIFVVGTFSTKADRCGQFGQRRVAAF